MDDMGHIKRDIQEIKQLLLGNGKIGMFSKVEIMWKGGLFVVSAIIIQTIVVLGSIFRS